MGKAETRPDQERDYHRCPGGANRQDNDDPLERQFCPVPEGF